MAMYGKLEYWDERYKHSGDTGVYDWYQRYVDVCHLLTLDVLTTPFDGKCSLKDQVNKDPAHFFSTKPPFFPSREKCRVLILGSGNSSFGEDMRNDGWTGEIVNIDFSSVAIKQLLKRCNDKYESEGEQSKMEFVCADITDGLPFGDSSFDLIICKGTLDSILCSSGSVNHVKRLVAECDRVLAPSHGCLFLVTYGAPDNRLVFLEHRNDPSFYWEGICIETVPNRGEDTGSRNDYVYICRKKKNTIEKDVGEKKRPPALKSIDEENAEFVDDQNIQNLGPARGSSTEKNP